jgi:hypothetical protein
VRQFNDHLSDHCVLASWTWNQFAYELGTAAAAIIAIACLALLSHKGWHVLRRRRQFSLLDLLVVFTLIGAMAGLFIGLAGDEKNGIQKKYRGRYPSAAEFKDMTK